MTYRNILVHVGIDARVEQRVRLACGLARDFDAQVTGVFVRPLLIVPAPYGAPLVMLGTDVMEAQRQIQAEQAARGRAPFEAICAEAGVAGEWYEEEGEPDLILPLYARYFDLCVVAQEDREGLGALGAQLPERVVMGGGRPALVVPYAGTFERIGERILVAWNASRESARAVADALPLLARAREVIVLEIDPPDPSGESGQTLVRRLARHGVKASARHTVSADVAPGEILLSALADHDADCLVMGAYGHSRMRELALGGVTRTVLAHMTVPVLMAY